MKKIFILLLLFIFLVSISACSLPDFSGEYEPKQEENNNNNNDRDPNTGEKDPDDNQSKDNSNDNQNGGNTGDAGSDGGDTGSDGGNTGETQSSTLVIIEANDVHGYIMQDENGKNGISNIAYSINQIRNQYGQENVLLIGNGDLFQGTGLVRMSMGQVMIDIMSEMGFDATCLGNHEFDWDLPEILKYFDGDQTNGEAKFPLVNSNVKQNGSLVLDQNILKTAIFEKAGVKVGFIGFIGAVKSSINALFADKYDFDTAFSTLTKTLCKELKANGADIIVISIHDGDSSSVNSFAFNQIAAELKDENGNYYVDAVINGHTHTHQSGYISRVDGTRMPVVQARPYASGSLYEFGEIILDIENKKVVDCYVNHIRASQAGSAYDKDVEDILMSYYNRDKETLEETIVYSSNYIDRYGTSTRNWVSSVMLNATNADIAICNTGGLRTSLSSGNLKFEDLYQFNPFDNKIIMHQVSKSSVEQFLADNESYYFWTTSSQYSSKQTITVAIIDYVYYGSYYRNVRSASSNLKYDTNLILRDLLIEDLKSRQSGRFNVNSDYESVLSNKVNSPVYANIVVVAVENKNYIYI